MESPFPSMTESEIMQSLQAGEERALTGLRDRLGRALDYYAVSRLKDPQQAQENINDVFINLWNARASGFESYAHVRNYLFNGLRQACRRQIDKNRKAQRNHRAYVQTLDFTDDLEREILAAELHAINAARLDDALKRLPLKNRQAMELLIVHQMGPTAIARVMGLNIHHVKKLKARAVKLLQEGVFSTEGSATNLKKPSKRQKNSASSKKSPLKQGPIF